MWGFRVEPAVVPELVRQLIFMLLIFGVIHWSNEQVGAVLAFVSALLTAITRYNSTSEHTLRQAGTTTEEVKRVAANPTQEFTVTQMSDRPR